MRRRTARAIAGGILVLSVAAVVASIPISLAARDRIEPGQIVVVGDRSTPRTQEVLHEVERARAAGDPLDATTDQFNPGFAVVILLLVLWLGVGFLVVSRQPTNWAGWIFIITGAPFPLLSFVGALVVYGIKADPGSVPIVGLFATIGEYALYPIALVPLLFLLYPDGHPPSRSWRWAVVGFVGGTTIALLGFLFRPGPFNNWIGDGILYENPLGVDGFAAIGPRVILVGTVIALLSGLSTVVAVRQRFKRSRGEERQRMRWLAFVASLAGFFFALQWVIGFAVEFFARGDVEAPIFEFLFLVTALTLVAGIPAAYLVAIFRHGLWGLDVVIKKAVIALVATALLALVAAVAIGGLGVLAISEGNVANAAIVGAVLGLLLVPAVRLARRAANRLVYGKRATPYEVLTEFSGHVGHSYSTEDVLPRMAQILAEATGASTTRIWLRVGNELRPEAAWPAGPTPPGAILVSGDAVPSIGEAHVVEVRHQGDLLGAITVEMPASDPMDPGKERLAQDLASQAGLVLRNVRLIEELRASRQRLVSAQDEERRKLERNIHDGAQQELVALGVQLGLAHRLATHDAPEIAEMLDRLRSQATGALENLRDLARGIYPPLLADKGLAVALEAQARKAALPVEVEADGIGRHAQEVEAAVYFCVLEALQNVAKYANASSARVRLSEQNGTLTFSVTDDGRGFDPGTTPLGTGMQGMKDRLEALGGALTVASSPGSGTTVTGVIRARADVPA